MTSTLYVDNLVEKTSGNGVHIPGHVIQVVSNFTKVSLSTTSASFVSSGLSVNITPKSTNSKILIVYSIGSLYASATTVYSTIFRDSTNIGDDAYGLMSLHYTNQYSPVTGQVFDSPSSTSNLNYSIRYRITNGTAYVSFPTYGHLTITAMEIAQ